MINPKVKHLDVIEVESQAEGSSSYTIWKAGTLVEQVTAASAFLVFRYIKKSYAKTGQEIRIKNSADSIMEIFKH